MEKGLISKQFWKIFDLYQRKIYFGIPESSLDIIYISSLKLLEGDWEKCFEYVKKMEIWTFP